MENLEETVTNLKLHRDKVIYIGLGAQDKKNENILDFHLNKPFTTSKIESLLSIILKANKFKD